jgi:hypothetical protein
VPECWRLVVRASDGSSADRATAAANLVKHVRGLREPSGVRRQSTGGVLARTDRRMRDLQCRGRRRPSSVVADPRLTPSRRVGRSAARVRALPRLACAMPLRRTRGAAVVGPASGGRRAAARLGRHLPVSGLLPLIGGKEGETIRPLDSGPNPNGAARSLFAADVIASELKRPAQQQRPDGGLEVDLHQLFPGGAGVARARHPEGAVRAGRQRHAGQLTGAANEGRCPRRPGGRLRHRR